MSYITTNSQLEVFYDYAILQVDNTCSSIEPSYTWSNLIQGNYQFSVVGFTIKGPGEAANLMLSTLPNNGKLILHVLSYLVTKMDPLKTPDQFC